jgi:hypothetical protein
LDVAIADADVGLAGDQRLQQLLDVAARILIVGVGVDDVVGAEFDGGVDARHERRGEAFVAAEADDVMHAVRARHVRRAVARPVVDHQDFDDVDSGDGRRQIAQRVRQRERFVQARDLDDQFGHATSFSTTPSHVTVRARS